MVSWARSAQDTMGLNHRNRESADVHPGSFQHIFRVSSKFLSSKSVLQKWHIGKGQIPCRYKRSHNASTHRYGCRPIRHGRSARTGLGLRDSSAEGRREWAATVQRPPVRLLKVTEPYLAVINPETRFADHLCRELHSTNELVGIHSGLRAVLP
jgi:hypothetical protein